MRIVRSEPRARIKHFFIWIHIQPSSPPAKRTVANYIICSQTLQIEILQHRIPFICKHIILSFEVLLAPFQIITDYYKK